MENEIDVHDAAALAKEHGGVLCFVSSEDELTADMAILSLWQAPMPRVLLLRVQGGSHDLVVRLARSDLRWLIEQGPQEMHPSED